MTGGTRTGSTQFSSEFNFYSQTIVEWDAAAKGGASGGAQLLPSPDNGYQLFLKIDQFDAFNYDKYTNNMSSRKDIRDRLINEV